MSNEPLLTLNGNLTAEPELRYTPSGQAVVNFTVAQTPRVFDRNTNEWKDGEAVFMRCALWGEAAENVAESLSKGARVIVSGRVKSKSWEKDGQKRTSLELDVEEIGPSLKYATAKITKVTRNGGSGGSGGRRSAANDDPWGSTNSPDEQPPF